MNSKLSFRPISTYKFPLTDGSKVGQSCRSYYASPAIHEIGFGFYRNLDELLGLSELWIRGHTHDSFDYSLKETRVVCNPRGYVQREIQESITFNPRLIIEV